MMKTKIQTALFLFGILLFSGCGFKQTALDVNHYSIAYSSTNQSYINSMKSIYIETPSVNKSFNTNAILYTQKPYLFEQYAKNRWVDLPSNMIHNYLVQGIEDSNVFKSVLQKRVDIAFDYTLKSNIINLYNSFEEGKSYAILKIKFDLVSKEKLLKTYSYDKKVLCQTNRPYGFIVAINKAFDEVMDELTLELSKEVK